MPYKSPSAFSAKVFYIFLELIILFMESIRSQGTKVAYRAKTLFFAPERYTAGFLYSDSLNSA